MLTKARDVVDHRAGFPVMQTVRATRQAFRSDLVLALLEHRGYLASMWRARGLPPYSRTPVALMTVWAGERLRTADPEGRRRLARRLRGADLISHFSKYESSVYADAGVPPDRLLHLPFGVNHRYYTPGNGVRDIPVLAVGQDHGRDYATLVAAVAGIEVPVLLVCPKERVDRLVLPQNVLRRDPVPLREYRALLRRAQVVAVPTFDLAYPTGQSVALEAAASGCAVVVTETRAMKEYLTSDDALLVPVGDVAGWRDTLREITGDQELSARLGQRARRLVEERFTSDRMWSEFATALAKRGITASTPSSRLP